MIKKIILTFFSALILLHGTITPVLAAEAAWYDTGPFDWYKKVYSQDISPASEIFGERYTAAQVQWVLYSLIAVPMNLLFTSELTACLINSFGVNLPGPQTIVLCGPQILALIARYSALFNNLMSYDGNYSQFANSANETNFTNLVFQNRPFSGISYTKHFINSISLVPEAHAQAGYGFGALQILQGLWTISRNFSYGLLIFAAIIMAIMIMLRTKISPQAVITAQSAIPRLVMAIILITFSYAIAGFMVDLVYVIIGIISAIMAPLGNVQPQLLYVTLTDGPGGWGILGLLWFYVLAFPMIFAANLFGNPDLSSLVSLPFIAIIFILVLVIIFIIMALAVLRTFFMMVRALVNIYLLTIFGPFYILGGTVTSSLGFGAWIRALTQNLLVFPAVGVLYYFALLFLAFGVRATTLPQGADEQLLGMLAQLGAAVSASNNAGWAPPLLGFGTTNAGLIMSIVSIAIVFTIPRTADIIQGFFSGRPFALGTAIGETMAPAMAMGAAARSGVTGELGYGAARAGQWLQTSRVPGAGALGRSLFGFGERQANVWRDSSARGAVGEIRRRGQT